MNEFLFGVGVVVVLLVLAMIFGTPESITRSQCPPDEPPGWDNE